MITNNCIFCLDLVIDQKNDGFELNYKKKKIILLWQRSMCESREKGDSEDEAKRKEAEIEEGAYPS